MESAYLPTTAIIFQRTAGLEPDDTYHNYKKLIGSASTQQIIRKNNEAWKSFFALLKKKKEGTLPSHITRVRPPGYWKDRNTGRRKLTYLVRCNNYTLTDNLLKLPFNLTVTWQGSNKWQGKQGRLEISYDELTGQWYAFMPVEVEPPHQSYGTKKAYVDLGVKVPIMATIEGTTQVWGYRANSMLAEWWYWNHKIAKHESLLKITNDTHTSKELRRLYRKRKRRFRDVINKVVNDFVIYCWSHSVSEIVLGELTNIRASAKFSKKSNAMIHLFWSHQYLVTRIKEKAEEYGITVREIDEKGTSSVCPRCGATRAVRKGRLFKCLRCRLEAHRDAVGCINIGLAQGELLSAGVVNRAVARPSFLTIEV
ncbi:MAG: RNA-guided endonuclease InsQ/TnpB family protein [Promethearchaeota archaeon]